MNDQDELDFSDIDLEFPTDAPVVSEFKIVVDTREQAPWHFTGLTRPGKTKKDKPVDIIVPLVHKGLKSGDYSIEGLEDLVSIERKSLKDAYASIGSDHDRFKREVERLNEMRVAAIVIESTDEDLKFPESFTQTTYAAMYGTKIAWMIRYPKVHWVNCPRREAEVWTYKFLEMFWRIHQHELQEIKEGAR